MNNNGIKVMLVILIVICLFQGCGLANIQTEMEHLNNYVSQLQEEIQSLRRHVNEMENDVEADNILMDWSYGIAEVDWENGNIHVACQVTLKETLENTRVVIDNGNGTHELVKSGSNYTGTVIYPINNNCYETVVYKYNGDVLIDSESVDSLGAEMLLCKYVLCEFYGMSSYGNDKLTLAGDVEYYINLEEAVTAAKLVCVDEEIELKDPEHGRQQINVSKPYVISSETDKMENQKVFYLELETESGMLFRTYPGLYITESYQVNPDEEVMLVSDPMSILEVRTPTGKIYEIELLQ